MSLTTSHRGELRAHNLRKLAEQTRADIAAALLLPRRLTVLENLEVACLYEQVAMISQALGEAYPDARDHFERHARENYDAAARHYLDAHLDDAEAELRGEVSS